MQGGEDCFTRPACQLMMGLCRISRQAEYAGFAMTFHKFDGETRESQGIKTPQP
jgi:hypothetical protein